MMDKTTAARFVHEAEWRDGYILIRIAHRRGLDKVKRGRDRQRKTQSTLAKTESSRKKNQGNCFASINGRFTKCTSRMTR